MKCMMPGCQEEAWNLCAEHKVAAEEFGRELQAAWDEEHQREVEDLLG